jgi:hypothetical protein
MWLTLLKLALNMAVLAIGKIPAEQWAQLGSKARDIVLAFLAQLQKQYGDSHPVVKEFSDFHVFKMGK